MAKKMHPSPEMVRDLKKVFQKHNWSGQPIGLVELERADIAAEDGGPLLCPNGETPVTVTYRLPNGDEVTKQICP